MARSYQGIYDDTTGPIYDDARDQLDQATNQALDALYDGNVAMADAILEGLGLSIEEREKWFAVAKSAIQPWVTAGYDMMPTARELAEMSKEVFKYSQELIMDPDAIYGTKAWQQYEDTIVDAVQNSASAESGLLSGNTLAAIRDSVGSAALAFRQNEIGMAQNQGNSTMANAVNAFNMGWMPTAALSNAAMGVGTANAANYASAYGALAAGEQSYGQNLANTYLNHANANINLLTSQGEGLVNSAMIDAANDRARDQQYANLILALSGAGSY